VWEKQIKNIILKILKVWQKVIIFYLDKKCLEGNLFLKPIEIFYEKNMLFGFKF